MGYSTAMKIQRKCFIAAVGFLIPLQPVLAEQKRSQTLDGVYKNLTYSDETGDLLGMAIEIQSSAPRVRVTTCEGGCYGGRLWPLTVIGKNLSFRVCDPLTDQDGHPAPCRAVAYIGQLLPNGRIAVQAVGYPETRVVLRRIPKPKPDEVKSLACQTSC
jgi:hypothetical protein